MARKWVIGTRFQRRALVAAFVLLLVALLPLAAQAHAIVQRSEPPDGGVLAKSPRELRLWFSEPIAPQFTQVRVLDAQGRAMPSVQAHTDSADPTLLVVTLPALPHGIYNVAYAVLSAADGHPTEGHLVFRVGAGAAETTAVAEPALSPAEPLLRWLNFSVLASLVGAVAVAFLLLRPVGSDAGENSPVASALAQARRRVLAWGAVCALAGVLAGFALLYREGAVLASASGEGGSAALSAAIGLLADPRLGSLWLARQTLLVVLAALLFTLRTGRAGQLPRSSGPILGFLSLALLATQALSGHAAAIPEATWLSVLADLVHLAAASVWAGGLLTLVIAVLPMVLARRGTPSHAALVHAAWGPFGVFAALSVGLLVATGLYSAGREVASLDALVTTLYGWALISKVALVLAAGALGLLNSMLLHPSVARPLARLLRRPSGWVPLALARLPGLILAEAALGLLVFSATAVMTSTPPPRGPEFLPQPPLAQQSPQAQMVDDLHLMLQVEPGRAGANTLTVDVAGMGQPEPAPILRVIVHLTYLGQNLGEVTADAQPAGSGVYQLSGEQLSLSGPWQIDVVVRRKGIEDSSARFIWTVAPPAAGPPVLSRQPIGPALAVASSVVLAVIILATILLWIRRMRLGLLGDSAEHAPDQPSVRL